MPQPQKRRKEPPVVTTMRMPKAVIAEADRRAKEQDLSRTHYVVNLIEQDAAANPKRRRSTPKPKSETPAEIFG